MQGKGCRSQNRPIRIASGRAKAGCLEDVEEAPQLMNAASRRAASFHGFNFGANVSNHSVSPVAKKQPRETFSTCNPVHLASGALPPLGQLSRSDVFSLAARRPIRRSDLLLNLKCLPHQVTSEAQTPSKQILRTNPFLSPSGRGRAARVEPVASLCVTPRAFARATGLQSEDRNCLSLRSRRGQRFVTASNEPPAPPGGGWCLLRR